MTKRYGFLSSSLKGIKIIFRAKPKELMIHCFYTVLHGLSWTLQVVFTQLFFDSAQKMTEGNGYVNCLLSLGVLVLAYAFCQVMNGVDNCHARILDLAVSKSISLSICKKIDAEECITFEDTERLDFINKATYGGRNILWVCITLLDIVFFYLTYFLSMSIYLGTLEPVLSISVLAVFAPSMIANLIQIRLFRDLENEIAPLRRENDYYERCICDIRETRLLGANRYFRSLYFKGLQKLNNITWATQLKQSKLSLVLDGITVLGYGCILFMIFMMVMQQRISIGAFAAVIASVGRLFSFMKEVISERVRWATENTGTLENYLHYIEETTAIKQKQGVCVDGDIVLNNVSFEYPNASNRAINNVSLTIKRGQTVAVVGENGSGKTTLCKLLLGIYTPDEGTIKVGEFEVKDIQNMYSAVFQNFCRYKLTLKDNICISDISSLPKDSIVKDMCEKSGVITKIDQMPGGIYTMMGRDFDGIELSGGQWQRIAIARGLYRKSNIIILDEPTAAIDPIEETNIYNKFKEVCRDKTAVVVTHRIGAARIADRIIVVKDGSIVQDGTHDELVSIEGEYKRLYLAQSAWYK